MSAAFWLLTNLFRKRIARETKQHLATIARKQVDASRANSADLLGRLAKERGPRAVIGKTRSDQTVTVPLSFLATAWGLVTGGTGSGKSMTAAAIIEALLAARETDISFGVLDAKGEMFDRTMFFIARLLESLPPEEAERLRSRLVIIDFASLDPITAYNVAMPWSGADLDYFATSRMETLQELFPSGDGISLRGGSILKHVIKLLAERCVPFSYADEILSSDTFRAELLSHSQDEELRHYFQAHLPKESRATVTALRARLAATLFGSASLKLALSGETAPDFRARMDAGAIVLVNCAGANIPRATARTLQSLVLSDIRHGVFDRQKRSSFLWVFDEAQHLFRTNYLREHMADLLTMSRSFAVHGLLITQSIASAVHDTEILETIHTNAKWALILRGSTKDASFLQPAFPVTGRREKPRSSPYAQPEFYSINEERNLILQEVAHLPDREGWLWIKSLTGQAIRLRTRTLDIPAGTKFQEAVERVRRDPTIGDRTSRTTYLEDMERRAATWRTTTDNDAGRDLIGDLTELYRTGEETGP